MALTTAQKQTLKADIEASADAAVIAARNAQDWDAMAALYNAIASPAFTVWKSLVSIGDIGKAFNSSELGSRTSLENTRLQTLAIYHSAGLNPSIASNRQFFDDIFSAAGGVQTRAALLALYKRLARRIEKLFATGTGSDGSPATLGFEGTVNSQDVSDAMGGL
jgi:hypothetical protein